MKSTIQVFQERWPLDVVQALTLEEYALGNGTDTFCYWVDQKTREFGRMSSSWPNKFGIFRRSEGPGALSTNDLIDDGAFRWRRKFGTTRTAAFAHVKAAITETIEAIQAGDHYRVGRVELSSTFKWKVASMYAPDKVFPVFHKKRLHYIAQMLGVKNSLGAKMGYLHRELMKVVPPGVDLYAFAREWEEKAKNLDQAAIDNVSASTPLAQEKPRYWVVGSSYKDPGKSRWRIAEQMRAIGGVAIGFLWKEDLTSYYLGPAKDINPLIDEYYLTHSDEGVGSARIAMPKYLQIAPGDLVAIKGHSNWKEGVITIVGYARIVERGGATYRHVPDELGHVLNAEFLVDDLELVVSAALRQTVHEVDPVKSRKNWERIFGSIVAQAEGEEKAAERVATLQSFEGGPRRVGTDAKNTDAYWVISSAGVRRVRPYHNEMQNSLLATLKAQFKNDHSTKLEEDYIDLLRIDQAGGYHLYELKTDGSPMKCIRQALGQLLAYAALKKDEAEEIKLYVVGPQEEDIKAKEFRSYLQANHGLELEYIAHQPKLE